MVQYHPRNIFNIELFPNYSKLQYKDFEQHLILPSLPMHLLLYIKLLAQKYFCSHKFKLWCYYIMMDSCIHDYVYD